MSLWQLEGQGDGACVGHLIDALVLPETASFRQGKAWTLKRQWK